MAQAKPLVSIIIPTYNRAMPLKRALDSVLKQTYKNFEVIVVDDGSTDKTDKRLKNYFKKKEIKYIRHKKNKGAQAARNTGIRASKAKWVAFLDSDDEWLPQRLEASVSLAAKKNIPVIYSKRYIENCANKLRVCVLPSVEGDVYKKLLEFPGPMFQGFLIKKKCLKKIGYLDESIVSFQEWDTSIRLAKYYKFSFVKKPFFIYHRHKNERISKDRKKDAEGWRQIVEKNYKEIVKQLGKRGLRKHHQILAKKYRMAGEFKKYLIYQIAILKTLF